MKHEPSWALWQALEQSQKRQRVDLHDNDRYTPGPLVPFSKRHRHAEIDGEGHVETEDITLKLLSQRFASGAIRR